MRVETEHRKGRTDEKNTEATRGGSRRLHRRTPLSPSELAHFRHALLRKRRQLLRDISGLAERARGPGEAHASERFDESADVGSEEQERSLMLDLVGSEHELLREVHAALLRIEEGRYGVCEATGQPIGWARLKVRPWARDCIEAARAREAAAKRQRNRLSALI